MKCANHSDRETEMLCSDCNTPFCEECSIEVAGKKHCYPCLEKRFKKQDDLESNYNTFVKGKEKSKFWAFVTSLVPGAGYMYLGLMKRGLETLILFFGTVFVASLINFDLLIALVVPVLFIYSVFDTQRLAGMMQAGHTIEDRQLIEGLKWERSSLIAYSLIGLGFLILFNRLIAQFFQYDLVRSLLLPLFMVGLGIFILYRSTRKGGANNGTKG